MRFAVLARCSFCLLAVATSGPVTQAGDVLLFNRLNGGKVIALDLDSHRMVSSIPAEDGAGLVGMELSIDRKSAYVVDGNIRHRLRVVDLATGKVTRQADVSNRVLNFSPSPLTYLSADGKHLLISTYEMLSAAAGVLVYELSRSLFLPAGLRYRKCAVPIFASSGGGEFATVCPGVTVISVNSTDLALGNEYRHSVEDIRAAVMDSNGAFVLALETLNPGKPWRLVQTFSRQGRSPAITDLRSLLKPTETDRSGAVDIAPGGKQIALQHDRQLWLLSLDPMHLVKEVALPNSAEGVRYTSDGKSLITMSRNSQWQAVVVRIDIATGKLTEFVIDPDAGRSPSHWRLR